MNELLNVPLRPWRIPLHLESGILKLRQQMNGFHSSGVRVLAVAILLCSVSEWEQKNTD